MFGDTTGWTPWAIGRTSMDILDVPSALCLRVRHRRYDIKSLLAFRPPRQKQVGWGKPTLGRFYFWKNMIFSKLQNYRCNLLGLVRVPFPCVVSVNTQFFGGQNKGIYAPTPVENYAQEWLLLLLAIYLLLRRWQRMKDFRATTCNPKKGLFSFSAREIFSSALVSLGWSNILLRIKQKTTTHASESILTHCIGWHTLNTICSQECLYVWWNCL